MKTYKNLVRLVLWLQFLFISVNVHAESQIAIQLQFSDSSPHMSSRFFVFNHATHKGGNPDNRWIEATKGVALEWSYDRTGSSRWTMGGLPTSRDGDAFYFGKGYHAFTPEFKGFSIGAGLEAVLLTYGYNDPVGIERVFNSLSPQQQQIYHQLAVQKIREAKKGFIVTPVPIVSLSVRYHIELERSGDWGYVSCTQRYLSNVAKLYGCGWSKDF